MSKLKMGDLVFVQAVVIDHASDLSGSPRYEVEFSENKASRWFPESDLKQATAPNRKSDSPGVQGLAQLGRNAIDRVSELEREREETIRKLRDPVAVHVAMLRGEIAVPPLAELLHVYGATFSDLDAANAELAKARETISQLRAQIDEYEREKLKRESQEPVAFRWLGRGKGWLPVYAEPPVPHVDHDWLANVIRTAAPHLCADRDELAEKIAEAINGRAVK